MALPAAALAQSPTDKQYGSTLEFISQGSGGDPGAGASASAPGGLPFTGLDVGLLAAVAVGLLIAGLHAAPAAAETVPVGIATP